MKLFEKLRWIRQTALILTVCLATAHAGEHPTPPGQPKTGPGGAEYAHAAVSEARIGDGDSEIWIYEPADPKPEQAPVIYFLHGWAAMSPRVYREWIQHLVRRGHIVLYPRYQASIFTAPNEMTGNAVRAIRAALGELEKDGRVRPDIGRVAAVGHSLGGVIAMNLTAIAAAEKLPQPQAAFSVEPGDNQGPSHARRFVRDLSGIMADYSAVPKGTLVLVLVGEDDTIVAARGADKIWDGIRHLPKADRDYVIVRSDAHGRPALEAGHFFPVASGRRPGRMGVDALDYYGTWKLFDGLTDAVFHGKHREYALGDTPEQRFMGRWSDDTPVKELKVRAKK